VWCPLFMLKRGQSNKAMGPSVIYTFCSVITETSFESRVKQGAFQKCGISFIDLNNNVILCTVD